MRKSLLFVFMIFVATTVVAQRPEKEPTKVMLLPTADSLQAVSFTLPVLTVIDNKCLGCHSPNSRNEKARDKMQWEQLQALSGTEALAKVDEILETLEKGEMPPEKMLQRFPNMKLTEEETALLTHWAEATLDRLENQ